MRADLHLHSTVSDGRVSPADVAQAAAEAGLTLVALADHDSTAGVEAATAAGAERGLRVISAIEISASHDGREQHILGYGVERTERLAAFERAAADRRRARMREMLERLRPAGIDISLSEMEALAGEGNVVLGRAHLGRALVEREDVKSMNEAFERYLGTGSVGYVASSLPTVAEAMENIGEAGGIAVWAHPTVRDFGRYLPNFGEMGIAGVECWRPRVPPARADEMARTAKRWGMVPTGGSDWHGQPWFTLGEFYVPGEVLTPFLERLEGRG